MKKTKKTSSEATGPTFITWVDDEPLVYVTKIRPDLFRQLRISFSRAGVDEAYFLVEMLELAPAESRATSQEVSDRSLVYLMMEFGLGPSDREEILNNLVAL